MGMYEAIKDGAKMLQATDNGPLLKNFMDIQMGYLALTKELEEANEKIKQLEERLKNKEIFNLNEKGYYEQSNTSIKYCSRCYEVDYKLVSLHEESLKANGIFYVCPQCKIEVLKEKKDFSSGIRAIGNLNKNNNNNRKQW